MNRDWTSSAVGFLRGLSDAGSGGFRSTPSGPVTLYGTCYASLGRYYLGDDAPVTDQTLRFMAECQDPQTGLMIGPELKQFTAAPGAVHDREHLIWHLTCAAIPACLHFGVKLSHPIRAAHCFCEPAHLQAWLDRRDLKRAWLEGNNILFIGQLLVYLRDVERHPAAAALDLWFRWLDEHADPQTSLWGTNGYCAATDAVYGGYHQLLVYYYENHPVRNPQGLVDTVLGLQHLDGGFHPRGNGGACEDVDSVDILVNLYKQLDYRRAEIRVALRRCLRHILDTQNADGGFPYNRNKGQIHMGIPGTAAAPNESTTFATWFRIHTLALMAEILTDEPELQHPFRFTNNLSMGWHRPWAGGKPQLTRADRKAEAPFARVWQRRQCWQNVKRTPVLLRKAASRARNLLRS